MSKISNPEFTNPLRWTYPEFTNPNRGAAPEFTNPVRGMEDPIEPRRVASVKIERLKDGNAVVHLR